jgi:hypothetical protein
MGLADVFFIYNNFPTYCQLTSCAMKEYESSKKWTPAAARLIIYHMGEPDYGQIGFKQTRHILSESDKYMRTRLSVICNEIFLWEGLT